MLHSRKPPYLRKFRLMNISKNLETFKLHLVCCPYKRCIFPGIFYLALSQMMKECSRWVRLPSARSLEEKKNTWEDASYTSLQQQIGFSASQIRQNPKIAKQRNHMLLKA